MTPSDASTSNRQDYLYLRYYARAYSLLGAKSPLFPQMKAATDTILNVINEAASHRAYCAQWGITEEDLNSTPESPATTAYGAYILDCGLSGASPPPLPRFVLESDSG